MAKCLSVCEKSDFGKHGRMLLSVCNSDLTALSAKRCMHFAGQALMMMTMTIMMMTMMRMMMRDSLIAGAFGADR